MFTEGSSGAGVGGDGSTTTLFPSGQTINTVPVVQVMSLSFNSTRLQNDSAILLTSAESSTTRGQGPGK